MSQFVEMFGNTPMSYEMQDCFSLIRNGANIKQGQFEGGIPITRIETISDEIVDRQKMGYAGIADNKYELYYLQDGDILISHINSLKHIGKCALYNKKENESIIHGMNLLCLRPNIVTINPVFAIHMLRSNIIRKGITDITKPAVNQASFSAKDFGKLRTIIPPMDKQMLFVSIAEQADKSKFGDFKSQFIEMFGNPLSLNQKNELKRLGECCILNPRRPNIALCDTDKVSFIPMPAVSEDGYWVDMTDEEYGKVKKGFTYFENNDVLFAKITPCMENGKGAIVHGLTNGIGMGSTEFHVLRPINGISSPYWLLALTRMPIFRERAAKNMSGTGGQKRVSASYLDHFMVGLPAIEEQRRFEAIYKQADKSKFGDFKSQFIEMYYNTHNKQTLESVCPIMNKGITPKYVESSSVLVINQACIHWDGQRLGNIKYHNEEIPVRKRILESGDVLLNATGNGTLGRCCVFICPSDNNTYINDGHVIALSTDRAVILPEVLNTYLSLNDTQAEIYRQYVTGSTNQVDIVFSDIKKMKVPVPSMDEQILFVEVLKQADKSKSVIQKALVYLNDIQSDELGKIA